MSDRARIPTYRRHKQSGQAVVTIPDGFGGRRDVLLGKYGIAASKREFRRVISEWTANGCRAASSPDDLTMNELLIAYWKHAEEYYGYKGSNRGDAVRDDARQGVRPVGPEGMSSEDDQRGRIDARSQKRTGEQPVGSLADSPALHRAILARGGHLDQRA